MKHITKRLRVLRTERDLTQRDLAIKAALPIGRYWEIENGYRAASQDEAERIAKVLKSTRDDIFAEAV